MGTVILNSMVYTPLLTAESGSSGDYSIKLNDKRLLVNSSSMLLSKVVPYTTMESSINRGIIGAFAKAAATMNMNKAVSPPTTPFECCFSSHNIEATTTRFTMPEIDFVMQSEFVRGKMGSWVWKRFETEKKGKWRSMMKKRQSWG